MAAGSRDRTRGWKTGGQADLQEGEDDLVRFVPETAHMDGASLSN